MKAGPEPTTIYRIARLYYAEGLSQEEIAGREGFSRSQVSRLIDRARELGYVKISLVPPQDSRIEELAANLGEKLGLRSVRVVPVRRSQDEEAVSTAIATGTADFIGELLSGAAAVGLGWGRTMYRTSELLPRTLGSPGGQAGGRAGKGPLFVPLVGISGDDNPNLQINTIIDRFSARFGTRGTFVNIPAVREFGAPLSRIEEERVAALRQQWKGIDAAVIGLGDPPSKSRNMIAELPQSYKDQLRGSEACGDILAQFFGPDGSLHARAGRYDLLAFDLSQLRGLKRVLCLAGGTHKREGIVAAARAGYMTDLVTDEATATAILGGKEGR